MVTQRGSVRRGSVAAAVASLVAGTMLGTASPSASAAPPIPFGPGPQVHYTVQAQPAPGTCHYRTSKNHQPLPDSHCTPGARNPKVTQKTIGSTICAAGYAAKIQPPVSVRSKEKSANAKSYSYKGSLKQAEYDYLIPLELGGDPNDPRGLWVERPSPGHKPSQGLTNPKDKVERQAYSLVCHHQVTLTAMQRAIATDWTTALAKVGYPDGKPAPADPTPSYRCFGARAMVPEHGCSHPYARPAQLDLRSAASDGRNDPCQQGVEATVPAYCVRGTKAKPVLTIALVGNSHARRLLPGLASYAEKHRWRVVTAMRSNCLGLVTRRVASGAPTSSCLTWSKRVEQQLLARHDIDAVVFAGYRYDRTFLISEHPTAKQIRAARAAVLETWRSFRAAGIRVIVIQDVPGMRPDNDPSCIAQSHQKTDPCSVPRSRVVRTSLSAGLAQDNPDIASYIPLDQYFCDAKLCHALIGGVVVYYDSHHMTTTFSKTLGPYLGSAIAETLKKPSPAHQRVGPRSHAVKVLTSAVIPVGEHPARVYKGARPGPIVSRKAGQQ